MRVLGIDPGTATTGYGIIEIEGQQVRMCAHGVIATPAGDPMPARLHEIRNDILSLVETYTPTMVGVEKIYFQTNVKTAISVAQARGVVLEALWSCGLPIHEYTPLQIKQMVTGHGAADKRQVQECIRMQLNLAQIPKPDDAADALGIALCTYFHNRY